MTGRWGPVWDRVAGTLDELGWPSAAPLRELREGGYSPASRWIVERPDGARAFVKARDDRMRVGSDRWFDAEHAVYRSELGSMMPVLHASHAGDGSSPDLLVLEDLSDARWGVPLQETDARALREALDRLAALDAPVGIRDVPAGGDHADSGWVAVAADPAPIVDIGLVTADWLERCLPALLDAANSLELTGDQLVHGDLWRQNWCHAARGVVIVDWTGAARGNARANHAWAEAGVRAAGGPPGMVLERGADDEASWAAHMAGLATAFLAEDIPHAAELPRLHETQLREAIATIAWSCEALGLPRPRHAAALTELGPWQP